MKYIFLFFTVVGFVETGFARCESPPPDHNIEDLIDVSNWAVGGAYANYAKRAGFVFDNEAYMNDNPHPSLFGFGFGTGTNCLDIDVMDHCLSVMFVLSRFYAKVLDPKTETEESFSQFFFRMAKDSGMDHYLSPIKDEDSL